MGKAMKASRSYSVERVDAHYRMSTSALYKFIRKAKNGESLTVADRSGAPTKMTPTKKAALRSFDEQMDGIYTFKEASEYLDGRGSSSLGLCPNSVRRLSGEMGWKMTYKGTRPLLTDKHKADRVDWAREHRDNDWSYWIHVDEKWFLKDRARAKIMQRPDIPRPKQATASRRYVPKYMYLTAVGMPIEECDFDGKLGNWRLAERTPASKRRSKNHNAGDIIHKPITITGKAYADYMINFVFRAIRRKLKHSNQPIHVQPTIVAVRLK